MRFRKHQSPSDEPLRDLPLVEAPDSIWISLENALDAGEKPRGRHGFRFPIWQPALVVASLVVVAGVYWRSLRGTEPQWDVDRLAGIPSIGSEPIDRTGRMKEGQWLETDASSRAVIHVGTIGTVQVDSNTRVRLVTARPTEHRLALARGRIMVSVTAPPRLFFVNTASSTAVDLGCAYTMQIDDAENGSLQVTLGWVSLEWSGRKSLVPAGASCQTRHKLGPGTPVFDDAAGSLKRAVSAFDFEKGGRGALDTILAASRVRDTLTLWHLLARVDGNDRLRVYNRMISLAPLPNGLVPAKVLQLDPQTLQRWREELAWKW